MTKEFVTRKRTRLVVQERHPVYYWHPMTTVLSQNGRIVLPRAVREQLHLEPGDDFEVSLEEDETITLRRISRPANRGLVDLLVACPAPFEIPPRNADDTAPLAL